MHGMQFSHCLFESGGSNKWWFKETVARDFQFLVLSRIHPTWTPQPYSNFFFLQIQFWIEGDSIAMWKLFSWFRYCSEVYSDGDQAPRACISSEGSDSLRKICMPWSDNPPNEPYYFLEKNRWVIRHLLKFIHRGYESQKEFRKEVTITYSSELCEKVLRHFFKTVAWKI